MNNQEKATVYVQGDHLGPDDAVSYASSKSLAASLNLICTGILKDSTRAKLVLLNSSIFIGSIMASSMVLKDSFQLASTW